MEYNAKLLECNLERYVSVTFSWVIRTHSTDYNLVTVDVDVDGSYIGKLPTEQGYQQLILSIT